MFLLFAAAMHAADFVVEDELLAAAPREVSGAIAAAKPENAISQRHGRRSQFIGKAVDLQGAGSARDWVATTSEGCNWAASAAPIWVVRAMPEGYAVVLRHIAYDLTVGSKSRHGMRNLATARATAARREEQLWKFDGARYRLARSRVADYSAPEANQ